ncbi:hypothetical protein F2Q69_00043553 [Brassica cretica]|uniref:Uncharacterized protein n=1 Tax=Brassica cretica TaxID=69181 RepID=A0A8S9NHG2_BRACR|nr:hypothetical protein F2Q69_00043553 [Brassica cretica]
MWPHSAKANSQQGYSRGRERIIQSSNGLFPSIEATEPWIVRPVLRQNGQATPNSPNGESDQLIQLAVGRVGRTTSNSEKADLDKTDGELDEPLPSVSNGSVLSKSAFAELDQSCTMHSRL